MDLFRLLGEMDHLPFPFFFKFYKCKASKCFLNVKQVLLSLNQIQVLVYKIEIGKYCNFQICKNRWISNKWRVCMGLVLELGQKSFFISMLQRNSLESSCQGPWLSSSLYIFVLSLEPKLVLHFST